MRIFILFLGLVGTLLAATSIAAGLPDTGQDLCDDGTNKLVECAAANTGDSAVYPRQDGRFGRDAKATTGTLTKVGGGAVGFDYTKIANDSGDLTADATLGSGPTDWACTRDNITGLTWEVKTAGANTELRFWGHTYTWYDPDSATNGGNIGSEGSNSCNSTLSGGRCNTAAYVAAVNAAKLCGYNDWRLPSVRELLTLVHFGASNPAFDAMYFPFTQLSWYWSATTYGQLAHAWMVDFVYGTSSYTWKNILYYARVVRGGKF